jgi:hypothetical protein
VYSFCLPREGNAPEECEDAYQYDAAQGRFAVADGATESAYARQWAQLLVQGFVDQPPQRGGWEAWLAPLQQSWRAQVTERPLPWYAERKVQQGAFASFLGLELCPLSRFRPRCGCRGRVSQLLRCQIWAVGDVCLFQVRPRRGQEQIIWTFPLTGSQELSDFPPLVGTRSGRGREPRCRRRLVRVGQDRLLLVTDALAGWLFRQREAGQSDWQALLEIPQGSEPQEAFRQWVEQQWHAGQLRNDDVTMLIVQP